MGKKQREIIMTNAAKLFLFFIVVCLLLSLSALIGIAYAEVVL